VGLPELPAALRAIGASSLPRSSLAIAAAYLVAPRPPLAAVQAASLAPFDSHGDDLSEKWQVPFLTLSGRMPSRKFGVLHLTPTGRGGTEVHAEGSPTVRRRELGALLKALRSARGLTAEQVAERLLISTSKVSRLETGQRGASARDINDLCNLYGVDDEQRQHLLELASEGKQRAWWQPLALPYSTYVGLEAEAKSIRDYGLGIMPGLLQTADYARAIVRAAVPKWGPDVVEQRVQGRLVRQQLLHSQNAPRFEAVVDESVLHRVVDSPAVMRAQLERLLELSELPNVTLRVIAYEAGALPAGNNKFIILRFVQPAVSDIVFVEGLTGDLYLEDPRDVEIYNVTFRTLVQLAASPDETREIIAATIRRLRRGRVSREGTRTRPLPNCCAGAADSKLRREAASASGPM
jgi:transcriptional regulator with XRE-family HTH domain